MTQPEQQRQPSWTAKERRLMSRSDEEILDELDLRLDYRVGWPKPLPLLPIRLTPILDVTEYIVDFSAASRQIRSICDAERVTYSFDSPRLVYRHHYDCPPTEEDVTIVMDCRVGQTPWTNALKEVRKYLAREDIQYRIEFIDFRVATPRTRTILPDNPIVSLWKDVYRQQVLSLIQGTEWQTVDVFHRGNCPERHDCPVTIVITAWDASESLWWEDLLPRIRLLWPHGVELCSANRIRTMDLDIQASARMLTDAAISVPIQIGTSVGIKGERGGGTLGGVIELQGRDGTITKMGLTNHHVVLDTRLNSVTDRNTPLFPSHDLSRQQILMMTAPCDSDTEIWIQEIEESINRLGKVADGDPRKPHRPGLKTRVSWGAESKRPELERILHLMTEAETREARIKSFDRTAGFVAASSGNRTININGKCWPLDWALIELHPQRPITNTVVDAPANSLMNGYNETEIRNWSTSASLMDLTVSKKGRTTGWTEGTVNSIMTDLQFTREKGITRTEFYGQPVSAWSIRR